MSVKTKHLSMVLEIAPGYFQGYCSCGWTTTLTFYEEADLLRAMHAHAVVTFQSYEK